jgi:hypothetical protein
MDRYKPFPHESIWAMEKPIGTLFFQVRLFIEFYFNPDYPARFDDYSLKFNIERFVHSHLHIINLEYDNAYSSYATSAEFVSLVTYGMQYFMYLDLCHEEGQKVDYEYNSSDYTICHTKAYGPIITFFVHESFTFDWLSHEVRTLYINPDKPRVKYEYKPKGK